MATKAELEAMNTDIEAKVAELTEELANASAPTPVPEKPTSFVGDPSLLAPDESKGEKFTEAAPGRFVVAAPREARHNPQPGHRI